MYKNTFKRLLDFLASAIALLLFFPLMLFIGILLCIANKGKPFFFQPRPGKNGKVFKIMKFKTMNDKRDASGNLLENKYRITKIGRIIRKTSLDELPQLINVLKGDMSLVGPRPLLVDYLSIYSETQNRRHEVRPGITGWAQVNGRNKIKWSQKFELDVWYVDHLSFFLDTKILWKTVMKVLKADDVSSNKEVTMPRFDGTN